MRVLLGLGHVQLAPALRSHDLRQRGRGMLRWEGDRIAPVRLVLGHRRVALDHVRAAAVDLVEVRVGERQRDLAHAVGSEVERDNGVAGADSRLLSDQHRLDELVGLIALIGAPRGGLARLRLVLGAAMDEEVVGELNTVPALVAVHRVVATDHGADAPGAGVGHPLLDGRQIAGSRRRQRVAPVGERVQHQIGHLELRAHPDQGLQVAPAGVDAAVGDQADQMQALHVGERRAEHVVGDKLAAFRGLVDPGEILHDDRPGPEVQVSHLRVAHLALGKADRLSTGGQLAMWVARPQLVEHRRVGQ